MSPTLRIAFGSLLSVLLSRPALAQQFNFNTGPIPPCDTTLFTVDVAGVGILVDPYGYDEGGYVEDVWINIATTHPWTMSISLTSPTGITILLSAFNGAGGQNYTDTHFSGGPIITTGSAPFSGFFTPQDGSTLSEAFVGSSANGTWVLTVIDTACAGGMIGGVPQPDSTSVPGTFGSTGGGGMAFGYNAGFTPTCYIDYAYSIVQVCPGGTFNLEAYCLQTMGLGNVLAEYMGAPDGGPYGWISDPSSVGPGSYEFWYSGDFGGYDCSCGGQVYVIEAESAFLGADQAATFCSNTSFDLTTLFDTTGLETSWTLEGVPEASPGAATQPGVYQITALNADGCPDSALVTLSVIDPPQLQDGLEASTCQGNTVDLTSLFDTGGLTPVWTSSGVPVADPTAVDTNGDYLLVATNAAGCSDTAGVAVTVHPNPVLGADQTVTACNGQPVDLGSLYDSVPYNMTWTLDGIAVEDPMAVGTAGTYTLWATSDAGCTTTATVDLAFVPTPQLGADKTIAMCADSLIDLTTLYPTDGLTTLWTVGGATITYPSSIGLPGNYQLVVSNGICTDTALVMLAVNSLPEVGPDHSFTLCPWQTVDLPALFPMDGLDVSYTLNGQPLADPHSAHQAGTYSATGVNASGCSATAQVLISNIACLCEADFEADALCIQDPALFTLIADSAVQAVQWDFGHAAPASTALNPVVHFAAGQDVPVTMQATLSCGVVTVERTVHVEDCTRSCHLWFPNAFSPNKDDVNETWNWVGDCLPDAFSLLIFNRWGEAIFSTDDPFKGWDGTHRGVDSPVGVYMYRAHYQLPYQPAHEVVGHITLVR